MKELLKQLWGFIVEAASKMEWRSVVYSFFAESILPELKKLVEKSESKIDDVIYAGVERLVDVFLKPHVV